METSGITYQPESGSHSPVACHPIRGKSISDAARCLNMILLTLLVLTLASSIAWLALHPSNPGFRVNSLHASDSLYTLNLTATNPNRRVTIFLERMVIKISILSSYGEPELPAKWEVKLDKEIVLGRLSHARVSAEFLVGHSEMVVWRQRVVAFDVEMTVSAKYRAGDWPTSMRTILFSCRNLKVVAVSSMSAGNVGTRDLLRGGVDCTRV